MTWWLNLMMGLLIGSFLSCYIPAYRNGFMAVLGRLASGKKKKKLPPKKK